MNAVNRRLTSLISIIVFDIFGSNGFEFTSGNITCDPLVIQTTQACFKIEGINKKWAQAREYCLTHDSFLATPESKEVNDAIKEFIKPMNDECSNDSKYKFWIGVIKTEKDFHFDGSQNALPYTDWDPEFPSPSEIPNQLGCALYRCDNNRYSWKPNMCSEKSHFICQLKACPAGCSIVTTTVEPTTEATTHSTTMETTTMFFYDDTTHVNIQQTTMNETDHSTHHSVASTRTVGMWVGLTSCVIILQYY